ncbi:MAG: nucleotidyltransferase [Sphingobacteriia bacterium]|jgi:predicted nucleotidyltransferase|nr:nucleotidyltransferase [Sphingobacteriia bacterium]
MLTQLEINERLKAIKPELESRFKVSSIGYFGSFANGTQNPQSDLDLLVEFSQPVGWNFFTLENYLEHLLGLKVDLVTRNSLKDQIKDSILSQVLYI